MSNAKHALLHKTFMAICNKKNWKMPINALIPAKDQNVVEEAIGFFTGGGADFEPSTKKGFVRVVAAGYYGNGMEG